MKLKGKHLLLFLGGAIGVIAGKETQAHADTVIVKHGDTTWDIAQAHKTTVKQIVKDNKLKYGGSLIFANQKLEVNAPDDEDSEEKSDQTESQDTKATKKDKGTTHKQGKAKKNKQVSAKPQVKTQATVQSKRVYHTPVMNKTQSGQSPQQSYVPTASGAELAAKNWIAARESGGSYTARNGRYIGRYQLDAAYLGGDYSPANQERVADRYVKNRYGSWQTAKAYWLSRGWY